MLNDMLSKVERFQREIVGLEIPTVPKMLTMRRVNARCEHMMEEVDEIGEAETVEEQADGFVDILYIALGALAEMGILPGPVFEQVHEANMKKYRGDVAKRPNSVGHDAVKPEGWTPPDLTPFMTITREEALMLISARSQAEAGREQA